MYILIENKAKLLFNCLMAATAESKYWRFRHEKFVRGKPELMVQMRRDFSKTQSGNIENSKDVEILKDKVTDLQEKVRHGLKIILVCSMNDKVDVSHTFLH